MQQVALFRNVNQGQRGHPRTAELVEAFAEAGVRDAVAFQSNGTVIFAAEDGQSVADDVRERLAARGAFDDAVYARPLEAIALLVDRHAERVEAGRMELTLFPAGHVIADDDTLAREAGRRRCAAIELGPGFAVVMNDNDRESNGTPTVQAVLGVPATSRGLRTLVRLVDRFGR